jgi:hypothetical protein
MAEKQIGTVIHYFDKAQVAVLKLDSALKKGDSVKLVKGDHEFEMRVDSMEVDREPVESRKKGEEVAIKVSEPAKVGTLVFKVTE